MTLYRQDADGLVPVNRVLTGDDVYEQEVRELAWRNLGDLTGEELFPVRRQARIAGGVVGIVALTRQGGVAVIEVKGSLDRGHVADCLEYSGWARSTSLDELAGLYPAGPDTFWEDWQAFTATERPLRIQRSPLVVLIVRAIDERTRGALSYLTEHGVPLKIVFVTVYEESGGVRLVEVWGGAEPSSMDVEEPTPKAPPSDASRRVSLPDLVEAGLLEVGAELVWSRPRAGQEYRARVSAEGQIVLADGRQYSTPSAAAMAAANLASCDGWHAWRVGSVEGPFLGDLRAELGPLNETS